MGAEVWRRPADSSPFHIFHLASTLGGLSIAAEIRPETIKARDLSIIEQALACSISGVNPAKLVGADGASVEVPAELVDVLIAIVRLLQAGNGASVAALHTDLTTVEAAELLNVSRPHLIKLCDNAAIAFRMVGTHRRLRLVDVLAYRDQQDAIAQQALDELTGQAEELGLYD